ncbi:hypothetical protein [Brevibacillus parabrevis]|uniref:Uncharacterized protein n=1 Tax=Brevibacillus parabrevis TaxID=54914 RepID=A0A4Y3PMQ8_BREPA|nr:hypothetical protein [Brevibacillus parabrevis]MBU8714733.1 hypothetical protein [Brevibacillus parabrevis]MED2253304.1 hypothetical protein [Brevibacillus parabrevis]WDV97059.1 hypothetical protein PSE45_08900 [Brevibacillus parabrevis]GEB31701.1 hypothetical protein BPA01_12810 [Brevibacillus parabrevis]
MTAFEWNLIYMVEWLSENVKYILRDEPFPLPVKGQHSLELLKHCLLFESDDDVDVMRGLMQSKKGSLSTHGFQIEQAFFAGCIF